MRKGGGSEEAYVAGTHIAHIYREQRGPRSSSAVPGSAPGGRAEGEG